MAMSLTPQTKKSWRHVICFKTTNYQQKKGWIDCGSTCWKNQFFGNPNFGSFNSHFDVSFWPKRSTQPPAAVGSHTSPVPTCAAIGLAVAGSALSGPQGRRGTKEPKSQRVKEPKMMNLRLKHVNTEMFWDDFGILLPQVEDIFEAILLVGVWNVTRLGVHCGDQVVSKALLVAKAPTTAPATFGWRVYDSEISEANQQTINLQLFQPFGPKNIGWQAQLCQNLRIGALSGFKML